MSKVSLVLMLGLVLQLSISSPVDYRKPLTPHEAARLESWSPKGQPMWQLSGQYQGDMVLTPGQRTGLIDEWYRWKNREIVYELSNHFTRAEKNFIIQSLNSQYSRTCIRPRQRRAGDVDYVYVTGDDTGCWSYVGRLGGRQELNLQRNGCLSVGTVAHEFLHALGFYHEHSATDRDEYIDILWENIEPGMEYAFDKFGADMITNFGQKYDYISVMHYDGYAFSTNGQPTIIPKDPNAIIGISDELSETDIVKLNKMYKCA